ncbi:MAG TPA: hypothetical protein VG839_06640 [Asticcacaulis sp.]|nr:hypothetical protein [Asticcacaulis sp.]
MTAVRAILACLWLLFGLTATAHASAPAGANPPCHVMQVAMSHSHTPPVRSHDDQTVMPCCNQPVIVTPMDIALPQVARSRPIRLKPAPAVALVAYLPAFEPHPPKTV